MTPERIQNYRRMTGGAGVRIFNTPRLEKNLALVEQLRIIGKKHESSPAWWRWLTRCTILL